MKSDHEAGLRRELRGAMNQALFQPFPPSARAAEVRHLGNFPLTTKAARDLMARWGQILPQPLMPPESGDAKLVGVWNHYLLCDSLWTRLRRRPVKSANTFKSWFDRGCSLLNALGGRAVWQLSPGVCAAAFERLSPSVARNAPSHLRWVVEAAAAIKVITDDSGRAKRLHDLLSFLSRSRREGGRQGGGGARGRTVPTLRQVEMLAEELGAGERLGRSLAPPEDVTLYLDLLMLGLRSSEALAVTAARVDCEGVARQSGKFDLYVTEGKTAAARRVIPLELHPHREGVKRVIMRARVLRKEGRDDHQLINTSGDAQPDYYARPRRGGRGVRPLNRALRRAGSEVGGGSLDDISPHDIRHSSITECLLDGRHTPELVAKWHGHADVPTTLEFYFHGLARLQARALGAALPKGENVLWVPLRDAADFLGVSPQDVYRKYGAGCPGTTEHCALTGGELRVERKGRPRYVDANLLVEHWGKLRTRTDEDNRSVVGEQGMLDEVGGEEVF